jgi:PAS domain S-box-containing protein
MNDRDKSKEELISELSELRKRIQGLETVPDSSTSAGKSGPQWERYRLISENTSDLIAVTTFEMNPVFTYASPSHERVVGYAPEELIGRSGFDFIHPEDKKKFLPLLKNYLGLKEKNLITGREYEMSEVIEYRIKNKSGSWHYLESTINIMNDELLFISRDVSEQKKTVESIKLAYAELMQIFNTTVEGVRVIDKEYNVLLVNETFSKLSGVSGEKMTGKKCHEVFNSHLCHSLQCPLTKILNGEVRVECDTEVERKDGICIPCAVTATPFRGSDGNPIGIVEYVRDIAERKRMEEQLIQSEKLKSLEGLAGGVAHNFNNMLAAILGRAQLLIMNVQTPPGIEERRKGVLDLRKSLEVIEDAALEGAHTVRRIQDFSRKRTDTKSLEPVNLNDVIESSLDLTKVRWKDEAQSKDIKIVIEKQFSQMPAIAGNTSELIELFTNLINNAIDAMPQGGDITIKSFTTNGQVNITVEDTGIGIPEAIRDRIFDPFFTTKGVQSTGLGLSAAYGIIKRHKGAIAVEGTQGEGTAFTMTFPVCEEAVEKQPVKPNKKKHEKVRILVIEDEKDIQDLIVDILQMNNFEVEVTSSGSQGIKLFQEKSFDLVFTDLGMPGMSGWQVAKEIKKINDKTPVALITGWQIQLKNAEMRDKGVDLCINKPFKVEQLLQLVQEGMEVKDMYQNP